MISVDASALVITALVFALVLVLKNLFFEPLANAMETRQAKLDSAARAWEDAERTIQQARGEVSTAVQKTRNEGYALLDDARQGAQAEARTKLDSGREAAQKQIADAQERLERESNRAVQQLEKDADSLAAEIASRILGRDVA